MVLNWDWFIRIIAQNSNENILIIIFFISLEYECVETMNVMINCLKLHDYNEKQCGSEVGEFLNCFQNYNVKLLFICWIVIEILNLLSETKINYWFKHLLNCNIYVSVSL